MSGRPQPALAGVIGWPITHSRSPYLHRHWLERAGLDGDYVRLPVSPEQLPAALAGLAALGMRGVNVTVPHKVTALALCQQLTPLATRVGAVNTIVVQPDGTLLGHNTDVAGFSAPLRDAGLAGRPVTLLGAGGAARAILVALADLGAGEVRLVNRDQARSAMVAAAVPELTFTAYGWAELESALQDAALVVNATSLGMTGQPPLDIALDRVAADCIVNDIVYAPLETALLRQARARGLRTIDGLEMLIGQAAEAFCLFFDAMPDRTDDAVLRRGLGG